MESVLVRGSLLPSLGDAVPIMHSALRSATMRRPASNLCVAAGTLPSTPRAGSQVETASLRPQRYRLAQPSSLLGLQLDHFDFSTSQELEVAVQVRVILSLMRCDDN